MDTIPGPQNVPKLDSKKSQFSTVGIKDYGHKIQTMSCEKKFAHAHMRAHSHVCDVRAKRLSNHPCDVRACGHFFGVRRAIAISHVFG